MWMLQIGNTPRLIEKVIQCLLVELVKAQHLQRQYTVERLRFTYFIDMTIAAGANERDDFIDTHPCSLHQKIATLTACGVIGVFVSPAGSRIQTTGQLSYLFNCQI